jgi:hypothetical protein
VTELLCIIVEVARSTGEDEFTVTTAADLPEDWYAGAEEAPAMRLVRAVVDTALRPLARRCGVDLRQATVSAKGSQN